MKIHDNSHAVASSGGPFTGRLGRLRAAPLQDAQELWAQQLGCRGEGRVQSGQGLSDEDNVGDGVHGSAKVLGHCCWVSGQHVLIDCWCHTAGPMCCQSGRLLTNLMVVAQKCMGTVHKFSVAPEPLRPWDVSKSPSLHARRKGAADIVLRLLQPQRLMSGALSAVW